MDGVLDVLPEGFADEVRVVHLLSNRPAIETLVRFLAADLERKSPLEYLEAGARVRHGASARLIAWSMDMEALFAECTHPFVRIHESKSASTCYVVDRRAENVVCLQKFTVRDNDVVEFDGPPIAVPPTFHHPLCILLKPAQLDTERQVFTTRGTTKNDVHVRFPDLDWLPAPLRPLDTITIAASKLHVTPAERPDALQYALQCYAECVARMPDEDERRRHEDNLRRCQELARA